MKIALGFSIFAIGYLTTMFYFQTKELKAIDNLITQSNDVQSKLLQIESIISYDGINLRNSLLKKDSLYLSATDKAIFPVIATLQQISTKNRAYNTLADSLEVMTNKRFDIQKQLFDTDASTQYFDILNANLSQIDDFNAVFKNFLRRHHSIEAARIRTHTDAYHDLMETSKQSAFLIAIISLTIFLLSYYKMNQNLQRLKRVNDELKFVNETFNNAEIVAGFGTYKINTLTNTHTYSDNFFRLLEAEPQSFTPNLDNLMKYIHPEDREEALRQYQESLNTQEATTLMYRYLLPSGKIKHIISSGKFRTNAKGEIVKIGVSYDVTEILKKTIELEHTNKTLLAINAELESFNNIVSHDLQEPLRKIQMFISRIQAEGFDEHTTSNNKNYFQKIRASAERMQNLMSDLVNYSLTVKGDKIFLPVDLNETVAEVLEELVIPIEEKKALISCDVLPTVLGMPFQMYQLFINLISNSLKYTQPDVQPQINISVQTFDEDVINGKNLSASDFYKIVVTDNGIGFDQQYADKIFLLFKRLETESSYKGTGLGLAICKRILENHNGYITVYSDTGKGSSFVIYLPKNRKTA